VLVCFGAMEETEINENLLVFLDVVDIVHDTVIY
jgi:hypothetical protein